VTKTGKDGKEVKVKVFRGMASSEVQDDYHGGMAEWRTAEGLTVEVPFRDTEELIIADIVGGLRSGMTYAGASTIKELQRKLDYVIVTPAGRIESMPHRTL
jgi:IMP dehydrogenase